VTGSFIFDKYKKQQFIDSVSSNETKTAKIIKADITHHHIT